MKLLLTSAGWWKNPEIGKEFLKFEIDFYKKFKTIMAIKITYFVHGTTTDNEKEISSGWSQAGLGI